MVGAQLTDLHLSEDLSEGFCSRPHQLSVKSSTDWKRFGPRELETSRVLLEEIQSLGTQTALMKETLQEPRAALISGTNRNYF